MAMQWKSRGWAEDEHRFGDTSLVTEISMPISHLHLNVPLR